MNILRNRHQIRKLNFLLNIQFWLLISWCFIYIIDLNFGNLFFTIVLNCLWSIFLISRWNLWVFRITSLNQFTVIFWIWILSFHLLLLKKRFTYIWRQKLFLRTFIQKNITFLNLRILMNELCLRNCWDIVIIWIFVWNILHLRYFDSYVHFALKIIKNIHFLFGDLCFLYPLTSRIGFFILLT